VPDATLPPPARAAQLILDAPADGRAVPAKVIQERATAITTKTLRKAREALGIKPFQATKGGWLWKLTGQ
jgi:hypothetical protein